MANNFHLDVVGKPFSKSVQKELKSRITLNQINDDDGNLLTPYHLPYVKLKRLNDLPKWNTSLDELQYLKDYINVEPNLHIKNKKFCELGYIHEEGVYKINEGFNEILKNDEFRPPPSIKAINIEQTDFTFYTIDVELIIPSISDFNDIKMKWLDFGLPVEVEWGCNKLINVKPTKTAIGELPDTDPYKQTLVGIIASFDYKTNPNRTITVNLKIISANLLFALDNQNMDVESKTVQINEIKLLLRSMLIGTKINGNSVSLVGFNDNHDNIYYVSDSDTYIHGLGIIKRGLNFITLTENPSGIINGGEIIKTNSNPVDKKAKAMSTKEYKNIVEKYIKLAKILKIAIEIGNKERQIPWYNVSSLDNELMSALKINKSLISTYDNGSIMELEEFANDLSKNMNRFMSNYYSDTYKDIESIYKTVLSKLKLNSQQYLVDKYYFISLRAIEYMLNEISTRVQVGKQKGLITFLNISNSPYAKLPALGSIYPTKMLFNPKHKRYERNDDKNKPFIETKNGDINLTKDIYISAPIFFQIINESKSIYGILNNIIDTINYCSNGMVNLKITGEHSIDNDYKTLTLTLHDSNMITVNVEQTEEYYTLDLFNPKYNLKSLEVITDIPSDIGSISYIRDYIAKKLHEKDETDTNNRGKQRITAIIDDIPIIKRMFDANDDGELISSLKDTIDSSLQDMASIYESSEFNNNERMESSVFLSYILLYYRILMESYKVESDSLNINNRLVEIPLKISFSIDGIAGIIPTQMFKVTNDSFPMGYDMKQQTNWNSFIVTNQKHTITNSSWTTNIQAQLYLSSVAHQNVTQQTINNEKLKTELLKLKEIL